MPAPRPTARQSKRPLNIAIVGLGYMGLTHIRAYQQIPNARIVAVCDARQLPQNGIIRSIAGNIKKDSATINLGPALKTYPTLDALLADTATADTIDIIDICTPTPLHTAQTITALRAGKHVLCEKPLARTTADTAKILRAAATAKGYLMPAMCMRFWTGWAELKQLIATNKYGPVHAAHFLRVSELPAWSAAQTYTKADTGGALYDLHIHDTDYITHLFGIPKNVTSAGHITPAGAIYHVTTQYHYTSPANDNTPAPIVTAEASWLHHGPFNMAFTINFARATLEYDFARNPAEWRLTPAGKKTLYIPLRGPDGYAAEIRYFVNCVAQNTPPATVTPADAHASLRVCEAEEKSIRSRKPIRL